MTRGDDPGRQLKEAAREAAREAERENGIELFCPWSNRAFSPDMVQMVMKAATTLSPFAQPEEAW